MSYFLPILRRDVPFPSYFAQGCPISFIFYTWMSYFLPKCNGTCPISFLFCAGLSYFLPILLLILLMNQCCGSHIVAGSVLWRSYCCWISAVALILLLDQCCGSHIVAGSVLWLSYCCWISAVAIILLLDQCCGAAVWISFRFPSYFALGSTAQEGWVRGENAILAPDGRTEVHRIRVFTNILNYR